MDPAEIVVLDGAMGNELRRIGAPFPNRGGRPWR